MSRTRPPDRTFPSNPYILFLYFTLMGSFLSYAPVPWGVKGWFAVFGMGLPFAWAAKIPWKDPSSLLPGYLTEKEGPMPGWPWILLFLLAAGIRLWRLTSLSSWPMPDDGMHFYYAAELGEGWRWKFFFSYAEFPPLMIWCLSLFFRAIEPSLFSLWLFPALISILTALVGGTAARLFLPRPFSFWAAALFVLNFPFLYEGRFCQWGVLVLFWMVLDMALLAWFFKDGEKRRKNGIALALGLTVGLGFFTGLAWPAAALCFALATWFSMKETGGFGSKGSLAFFGIPLGVMAGVYAFVFLTQGGHHVRSVWLFQESRGSPTILQDWTAKALSLFWSPVSNSDYGPLWGGFLNPLLSAFFLLGLLECIRYRRHGLFQWISISLPLLLLPAFLARGFTATRWVQAFPIILMICACGGGRLWGGKNLRPRWTAAVLGSTLAVSACLDLYHLAGPYHRMWGEPNALWRELKSAESFEAYQDLLRTEHSLGKGFLLYDLQADPTDQTLDVACFPFDASRNRSIAPKEVKWVAFLADADEKPFLERRFPEGRWYWLPKEVQTRPEPQMLGVVAVSPARMDELGRWMAAGRGLEPLTTAVMDNFNGQSQAPFLKDLERLYPLFRGDAFLETCFWEKAAFHQMAQKDDAGALGSVEEALKRGYPAAHLYNMEGVLLKRLGRVPEARRAFQEALRCKVNFSPAAQNLEAVKNGSR